MAASTEGWMPPPPAPAGFRFDREFPNVPWHQRWELFQGVYTPGRNDVAILADLIGLPRDLRGMRVLDIGAWHGCFSFECERRGASEVVALTMESDEDTGFRGLARLTGSRVVRQVPGTVYHLDAKQLGHFDLVLFLGVLYHLRYPLLAIDNIRNVCRGTVLAETHVIDGGWLKHREVNAGMMSLRRVSRRLPGVPLWRYYHDGELMGDKSNFFGPNCQAVLDAFASAGFAARLLYHWRDRATFEALAQGSLVESLQHCYEMQSPTNRAVFQLHHGSPAAMSNPPRAQPRLPWTAWQRVLHKLLKTVGLSRSA
jgi:tRNA (mo5U34)-methyltransferase